MESANGVSNLKPFDYTGKYVPLFAPSSTSYSDSSPKGGLKSLESANYHQRCSSESFLMEEQPSWLEELLNESETIFHRGHLRSASDSFAFLRDAEETFGIAEESKYVNSYLGNPTRSQNLVHYKDMDITSVETKGSSLAEKNNQDLEEALSSLAIEHSRDESSSQNLERSGDKASGSQLKPSGSKADSKRAKQHNAHRSRVRKLQYIAHLERTVEILKAEGSEVSAELEFVEQQNIILTMENRALRQRLESISQEQIIKHWEQGMLEREIGRLQNLYHLQKQQQQMQLHQQQQQQQHNQHPKPRRNRSRDFDHQVNNSKNKEASSSKSSTSNGFVRP
ncbi:hypothetical protein CDL12_21859 [Handroanthus impetiginosus]|uniref:BZIP domain-containing protein n=1 Tax=Handroanthus impetiginosus TaxID=429701 RepID=A0A2G9GK01_9LAMI|nr:hypothetical protein CDL12_21859 [Handroanthus impetiginosus]